MIKDAIDIHNKLNTLLPSKQWTRKMVYVRFFPIEELALFGINQDNAYLLYLSLIILKEMCIYVPRFL